MRILILSRFRDISRGGVRIVRGASKSQNAGTLFDEAYGLALTQQHKNKGIVYLCII